MSTVQRLIHLRQDEIEEIFRSVDKNGNGEIDFSEFCQASLDSQCLLEKENLRKAFDAIDLDGNGGINREELNKVF